MPIQGFCAGAIVTSKALPGMLCDLLTPGQSAALSLFSSVCVFALWGSHGVRDCSGGLLETAYITPIKSMGIKATGKDIV